MIFLFADKYLPTSLTISRTAGENTVNTFFHTDKPSLAAVRIKGGHIAVVLVVTEIYLGVNPFHDSFYAIKPRSSDVNHHAE